jgi:hypothetical protein
LRIYRMSELHCDRVTVVTKNALLSSFRGELAT